jgi:hypothetical protein
VGSIIVVRSTVSSSGWWWSIFIVSRLNGWDSSDSGRLGVVRVSYIVRGGVCWEGIWVHFLDITGSRGLWLALPELSLWRAGGVAVVGGWAVTLFFAVMTEEHEFDEDGEEKEDAVILLVS